MVEPRRNVIDRFKQTLSVLNDLNKQQRDALVQNINNYGINLSINKIEKLTGLSATYDEARQFRGELANLIHNYLHHKEAFNKDVQTTEVDKNILSTFNIFLGQLNQKGIEGLNGRFQLSRTSEEYVLRALDSQTYLREVRDDDEKVIGLVPIVRLLIEIEDDINETAETIRIDLNPEECETFLKGLLNMQKDFFSVIKNYKTKMGDLLLYSEED